jgi:hypothetical protein
MTRISRVILSTAVILSAAGLVRADDKAVAALLDKAIKAVGGEPKLAKAPAIFWKGKGKIIFNGMENEFTSQVTAKGLDHVRSEFEGDFGGNKVKGVTLIVGDKGWRAFGDMNMAIEGDFLTAEKRNLALQILPATLVGLKGKGFKLESVDDEKVGDKPAAGIKVTEEGGKDFRLYFDKESGLPVKLVAVVAGFMGDEYTQETTFSAYKEFDGIKKATKIENRRDGELFVSNEITEFKILEKVPAETFAEPK